MFRILPRQQRDWSLAAVVRFLQLTRSCCLGRGTRSGGKSMIGKATGVQNILRIVWGLTDVVPYYAALQI